MGKKIVKKENTETEEGYVYEEAIEPIPDLVDLYDEIDNLEDNIPDRRTKEYQKWNTLILEKIKLYNKLCGYKAYSESMYEKNIAKEAEPKEESQ